jgi:hypothetical protein
MTDNLQREFLQLVKRISSDEPPTSAISEDVYDRWLSVFIKETTNHKQVEKLRWQLMRVGIRSLINDFRSEQRSRLKSPLTDYEAERAARKKASNKMYAAVSKERKTDDAAYAQKHGIALSEVSSHRTQASADAFRRSMDAITSAMHDEVARRVHTILTTWMCDGLPLGKCTGQDLLRSAGKEEAVAKGHLANMRFYRALQQRVPDDETVECSLDPATFIDIFDRCFTPANSDVAAGVFAPSAKHPEPQLDNGAH